MILKEKYIKYLGYITLCFMVLFVLNKLLFLNNNILTSVLNGSILEGMSSKEKKRDKNREKIEELMEQSEEILEKLKESIEESGIESEVKSLMSVKKDILKHQILQKMVNSPDRAINNMLAKLESQIIMDIFNESGGSLGGAAKSMSVW